MFEKMDDSVAILEKNGVVNGADQQQQLSQQNVTSSVAVAEEEKELSQTQKLMKQVKEAGTAGIISYAFWELGFWLISIPVCILGYREVTG